MDDMAQTDDDYVMVHRNRKVKRNVIDSDSEDDNHLEEVPVDRNNDSNDDIEEAAQSDVMVDDYEVDNVQEESNCVNHKDDSIEAQNDHDEKVSDFKRNYDCTIRNKTDLQDELHPKYSENNDIKNSDHTDICKPKTVKEAIEQRNEIFSETQRMIRESRLSLPYHVPKSRTIKEFLTKRPKFAAGLLNKKKVPAMVAIKMSKSELEIVSKKLEEREKVLENFYKSDSEDDDKDKENINNTNVTNETELMTKENQSHMELKAKELDINEIDNNTETDCEKSKENLLKDSALNSLTENITEDEKQNTSGRGGDNTEHNSGEFSFDLQGIDSDDEQVKQKSTEESPQHTLEQVNSDNASTIKMSKLAILKEKLKNRPLLIGDPNDIIDLGEGTTNKSGVMRLKERFLRDTATKIPVKHDIHVSVVNVDHGEVHEEVLQMSVEADETKVISEVPGIRLKKLRKELESQIAKKRTEHWQHKHITNKDDEVGADKNESKQLDDENEEEEEFEDVISDEEDEEYERNMDAEEDEEESEDDADCDEGPSENVEDTNRHKSRKLKRIVKAFEDSDDDEGEQDNPVLKVYKNKPDVDGDFIPPNLPRENVTPVKYTQSFGLSCITPLTGIDLQIPRDTPSTVGIPSPLDCTPSVSNTISKKISKSLFAEAKSAIGENVEELAELCSGTFPTQQTSDINDEIGLNSDDLLQNTQSLENLEDICSGKFPSQTQSDMELKSSLPNATQSCDIFAESVTPSINVERDNNKSDSAQPTGSRLITESEQNLMGIDDKEQELISELLNEEESNEVLGGGVMYDDDDDTQIKHKQTKILNFSDDESDDDNDDMQAHDDGEDDVEDNFEVDYDSEENEIERTEHERKPQLKLADFLDEEAELSGSEWGSEDEDEQNLDQYDVEFGDEDQFDKDKLRSDLEKIHMRTILDEDKRDVKFLQELLLEDGELHGTGRQRQFRWKNMDNLNADETDKKDDDDDERFYEAESNEDLVKMRYERELYLQKLKAGQNESNKLIESSSLLKLGQQVSKCVSSSVNFQVKTGTHEINHFVAGDRKSLIAGPKGSFLNRDEHVLNRIAEFTKINSTSTNQKQTTNFLFQSLEITNEGKKRKASQSTPKAIKKLRMSSKITKLTDL